jgi:anti-sigma-K factor RskA
LSAVPRLRTAEFSAILELGTDRTAGMKTLLEIAWPRGDEGKIGMAVGPEQRLSPEDRANLAAYIDGELTENESRAIATKLSLSPTARREVESLKKTWELLEFLPRPNASLIFSERTLTSVRSLETRAGLWDQTAGTWFAQATKLAVCAVVAVAALGLGFTLTRWVWPDPLDRLVRDLSLAEHLDEYKEVGSFEFLEELAKSKEFGAPSSSH